MKYFLAPVLVVLFSLPLTAQLDPRVRYGTYLGGSLADCYDSFLDNCANAGHNYFPANSGASVVTMDKQGNIFVAGGTSAVDFPTTAGAYRRTPGYMNNGFGDLFSSDSFVAKFSPSGALVWSTYLLVGAGPGLITFDSAGNVVIVGGVNLGDDRYPFYSPFIAKLNSTGTAMLNYKLLVSRDCTSYDGAAFGGAAVDSSGAIYIAGSSGYGGAYNGNCIVPTRGANEYGQGFVVKLNSAWSKVYAARVDGQLSGIAVDTKGNVWVTGDIYDSGAPNVARLNTLGALTYSNTFGAEGTGIAVRAASNGDAILTGWVWDAYSNMPATTNIGTRVSSGFATFVRRINLDGQVIYSTVIHGSNMQPSGLALNSADEPFVTGSETAAFYINRYANAPAAGAFLLRLNNKGNVVWLDSTFAGGSGSGIFIDAAWNAWVVGSVGSGQYFPLTANAYQKDFKNAASQGFLAKLIIDADLKMQIQGTSPNPVMHGSTLTYTLAVYNNGPDVSDGDTITDVLPAGTTFVSYSTTNGTCTHPAVGFGGTFKCTRSGVLNKGSYWGPVKLTVKVNAAAGTTLKNTASVAAKTQDMVSSDNSATVYVKVQ